MLSASTAPVQSWDKGGLLSLSLLFCRSPDCTMTRVTLEASGDMILDILNFIRHVGS